MSGSAAERAALLTSDSATTNRDVARAPGATPQPPVTREMFDQLMVGCYAPASRGCGTATGGR